MTALLLKLFIKNRENTDDPAVRAAIGKLAGITGIVCNLLLFAGKLLIGLVSGSVAITADAANNLSDASSSVVTLLAFRLSQKPADEDHPYGHARYEYLAGLAIAFLILLIGSQLAVKSIERIITPAAVQFSTATFAILLGSIITKLWMALFYRSLGKRIRSSTLQATSADCRNDVIASLAVLAGCLINHYFGVYVDAYFGLAVAVFILHAGFGVAKETISPLLGAQADRAFVNRLSALILSHDKILGCHDLLVHDYGPGRCFASVHAEMSADEDVLVCHDIIDAIERQALEEMQVHLVIHYDPVKVNDTEWSAMRETVETIVKEIDPQLSIHDFRIVKEQAGKTLLFDLAMPYSLNRSPDSLKQQIDSALARKGKRYITVIRFDEKA